MKKIATALLIFSFFLGGCMGTRSASVGISDSEDGNVLTFQETNFTLISPPISPSQMSTLITAKANAKLIESMGNGTFGGNKGGGGNFNYLVAIINNDARKSVYFFHPEIPGNKVVLRPGGGFYLIPLMTMPKELTIYSSRSGSRYRIRPLRDFRGYSYENTSGYKKYVAGQEVDLRYTINKVK